MNYNTKKRPTMKPFNFILEKETEWQTCGEGVARQIMGYGKDLMLVKVLFEKGAVGAMHKHVHSQSSYIVSGIFEVTVGGETRTMRSGDGYYVGPDVEHGVLCIEKGILIDTFSPCREDFL